MTLSSATVMALKVPVRTGTSLTALTVTLRLSLKALALGDVPEPLSVTVQLMVPVS